MHEFRADLHCHSTCSDGTLTPSELVRLAKKSGLSALSITDHDTVFAYKEAMSVAREEGIILGAGVEFSSIDEGVSVHILGYDIDLENSDLLSLCQRHVTRRKERNQTIFTKLEEHGMPIDHSHLEAEMAKGRPVGRPHIAQVLVEAGYVSTIDQAFKQFLGDGCPCFDSGQPISTDETIDVIHMADGKAFIAHPEFIRKSGHARKLLDKPFDGIEVFYSRMPAHLEAKWHTLANERGLLISGGSDFHGAVKPDIRLGCSWVDEMTFNKIFTKKICP